MARQSLFPTQWALRELLSLSGPAVLLQYLLFPPRSHGDQSLLRKHCPNSMPVSPSHWNPSPRRVSAPVAHLSFVAPSAGFQWIPLVFSYMGCWQVGKMVIDGLVFCRLINPIGITVPPPRPFLFLFFFFWNNLRLKENCKKIVERNFIQLPVVLTSFLTMERLSKPGNEPRLNTIHWTVGFVRIVDFISLTMKCFKNQRLLLVASINLDFSQMYTKLLCPYPITVDGLIRDHF